MSAELEGQIQELEVSIENLQEAVDFAAKVRRLSQNKDFQEVVEQGYFINEASRMLLLRDDPSLPQDKKINLEADMYGPGAFKRFLFVIIQQGMMAESQIAEFKETMDEIHLEMSEEGGAE